MRMILKQNRKFSILKIGLVLFSSLLIVTFNLVLSFPVVASETSTAQVTIVDNGYRPTAPIVVPDGHENYLIGIAPHDRQGLIPQFGSQELFSLIVIGIEVVVFTILLLLLFKKRQKEQTDEYA